MTSVDGEVELSLYVEEELSLFQDRVISVVEDAEFSLGHLAETSKAEAGAITLDVAGGYYPGEVRMNSVVEVW